MKKLRCRVLWIAICVVLACTMLTACTAQIHGPTYYTFDGVWKTDGNEITLLSATVSDRFTDNSGIEHTAAEGKRFLLVEYSCAMAQGWSVAAESCISAANGYTEPKTALYCDPIQTEQGKTLLVFSVFQDWFTGELKDYKLMLVIEKSDAEQREQGFLLG